MPRKTIGSFTQHYRIDGPDNGPALVLSHSLGLDLGAWDAQVPDLARHFRVIRYDLRGHGASDAPAGDYTIADLGADVIALADALGIDRFAFCGLSIGGMIGQWLGAHAPARLTHLALANTSPRVARPAAMGERRGVARDRGMPAIVDLAMPAWFTPSFTAAEPSVVAMTRRMLLACDPVGYAGCCAAIRDMDQTASLARIAAPTLIIGGDADASMPWPDHGGVLARSIPGARVVHLDAAHLSSLERPRSFTAALLEFLLPPIGDAREEGERARRSVLGDAHVDRAQARANDFTRDFQDLLTRSVWGAIWTRPGLDHRTRRLLVLTTLASLGRWDEFRLHLTAAIDHGVEWCDIKETLLQVAAYAGVPAANTAFHMADEVRREREEKKK